MGLSRRILGFLFWQKSFVGFFCATSTKLYFLDDGCSGNSLRESGIHWEYAEAWEGSCASVSGTSSDLQTFNGSYLCLMCKYLILSRCSRRENGSGVTQGNSLPVFCSCYFFCSA